MLNQLFCTPTLSVHVLKFSLEVSVGRPQTNGTVQKVASRHALRLLSTAMFAVLWILLQLSTQCLQDNCGMGNSTSTQTRGNNIVKFLGRCLPEETIKKQAARKVHLVIRQMLKLSGKNIIYYDNITVKKEAYVGAIHYVAKEITGAKDSLYHGDVFQNAGTSITECFLHARQWLDHSTHSICCHQV